MRISRTHCQNTIKPTCFFWCAMGFFAFGAPAAAVMGQEGPPLEQIKPPAFASLSLTLDAQGTSTVHFFCLDFAHPVEKNRVASVFRQCLRGELEEISLPQELSDTGLFSYNVRSRGAFERHGLIVRGQMDLTPLWALLREHNLEKLSVSISHTRGGFSQCSLPGEKRIDWYRLMEQFEEMQDHGTSIRKKHSIFSFLFPPIRSYIANLLK
jgi:hypothetical protein